MRFVRSGAVVLALLVLVTAAPVLAHVTVQPDEAEPESFARFAVRVPNERDDAATVKVEVQLPESLVAVAFQPKPGWTRTVERKQRGAPVELHGEQVADYVASVTWEGGRIEPGEFEEFGFSARTPATPGTLPFPALQTYEGDEVVRWTGPADAEEPAARVQVVRPQEEDVEDDDDSEVPAAVPWAALAVAVVAFGVALAGRRRA